MWVSCFIPLPSGERQFLIHVNRVIQEKTLSQIIIQMAIVAAPN